jgi:hypothetical protein
MPAYSRGAAFSVGVGGDKLAIHGIEGLAVPRLQPVAESDDLTLVDRPASGSS